LIEIKETLSALRVSFTLAVVVMLTIGSGLIGMYRVSQFNILFYFGIFTEIITFVLLLIIGVTVIRKIKEIRKV